MSDEREPETSGSAVNGASDGTDRSTRGVAADGGTSDGGTSDRETADGRDPGAAEDMQVADQVPDLARQELADELNSIRALGENLHG